MTTNQGPGHIHMLFVDDSPTQRALWMYSLSESGAVVRHEVNQADANTLARAGDKPVIEMFVATSGAKAVELIRAQRIDLLITDIEMPDMSGWDVAKAALSIQPGIKIMVVSSTVKTASPPPEPLTADRVKLFAKADRALAMKAVADFVGNGFAIGRDPGMRRHALA